ncbi:hypothetical protein [Cellulomonas sp.]|uniref:hypothetical protein n=1 Tax=Cellulomonas sp. TaxID=40001 RepID=UPI0028111B50|nr:hypothetical protein [Cellulomonas sp.]
MSTPSTDPASDVPWGRSPLAEIPVPPSPPSAERHSRLPYLARWNATVEQARRQAGEAAR